MQLTRSDHIADLLRLRADHRAAARAIGDNFAFEENVGPDRLGHFEGFAATAMGLLPIAAEYFFASVQGSRRNHLPSTFSPPNAAALMPAGIERTQKVVRIERLDEALNAGSLDFDQLQAALAARPIDRTVIDPLLRAMNGFPGARPCFACFRAEAAPELAAADWLQRMIARLGLGHHALKPGETGHFALMQYTVEEVFQEATVAQPFAVPTVLESRNSEFFFPAPAGQGVGYAVDLAPDAGRNWIREFLHIRLTWRADHLARVARLTGPTPAIGLAAVRDAHLTRVRTNCARPDYGAPMSGEVDP